MNAKVEKLDGTFENREMGEPQPGEAFCDQCNDDLSRGDCYCGWPRRS